MTEAEWLAATDPKPLLMFLSRPPEDRAARLFAAAACRRVESLAPHPSVSAAIALAEAAADGPVPPAAREAAEKGAFAVWREFRRPDSGRQAAAAAARAVGGDPDYPWVVAGWVQVAAGSRAAETARRGAKKAAKDALREAAKATASRELAALLREVVGNPFRPATANPSWLTSAVLALARQIYESRDFAPMPILADALQDAGCDDADVLAHCRGPGPHVRGCWVVDLLLGRGR